jgi:hypothetical protein
MMEYFVGQQVRYLNAAGTGVVKEVHDAIIVVTDEFGFDHEHDKKDLLPANALEVGEVNVKDSRPQVNGVSAQQVDRLLIDLHAHELIENTRGMSKYEILNHQIQKAKDIIAEARRRKVLKVLIIHGKGTGRLKDEVHQMLGKMGGLEFYFADFADGGYGATEVRFLSSKH